ncbi:hypothetical protein [Rhodopirellula sallentina]|uniref:Secreted protein n=1 Tax=Rhodopirellula sallentina SM41 TaxID=1263870 RepID=M5U105_9BACT|nr:hypothetical protein [Rhodopirellula sallentina]EMI55125.1 secreted protein [Rhodopirellula sallentina SM41]
MKYVITSFLFIACFSAIGCQESGPELAYDSTDVEQYLEAHPELKEEQPYHEPSSDE